MRKTINVTKKPSQEQIEMLLKAAKLPIHTESEYHEFSERCCQGQNVQNTNHLDFKKRQDSGSVIVLPFASWQTLLDWIGLAVLYWQCAEQFLSALVSVQESGAHCLY